MAYDTLIDVEKRKQYDSMTNIEKEELFNVLEEYINKTSPEYSNLYNNIINSLYNDKLQFQDDINNFNFLGIYNRFKTKINKNYKEWFEYNKLNKEKDSKKVLNIKCTLLQKYKDMYRKIKINNNQLIIPLRENQVYFNNYIINITVEDISNFIIINDNDLLIQKNISLYEYIYGGKLKINHIDNTEIDIKFKGNISRNPIHKIVGKGLPFTFINEDSSFYEYKIADSIIKRGDLIIKFNVSNLDDYKEKLKK
jgi:DnaJ-class molecular chaperone